MAKATTIAMDGTEHPVEKETTKFTSSGSGPVEKSTDIVDSSKSTSAQNTVTAQTAGTEGPIAKDTISITDL